MLGINQKYLSALLSMGIVLLLSACSTPSAISSKAKQIETPNQWRSTTSSSTNIGNPDWLAHFQDPQLVEFTHVALANNRQLLAQHKQVEIAAQTRIQNDASDWPELSLAISQSRSKRVSTSNEDYQNEANIALQASYELDVWGKLSDQQQQANLNYLSTNASFLYQREQLAADIAKAWFNLSEAQQLLKLYKERAANLSKNFDIINSTYQLGLSDALDVYLTQNNLSSEQARFAAQQQVVTKAKRTLELLLGKYPEGKVINELSLPLITDDLITNIPSQMLQNRYDLNASWYQLLATDANLAIAHKSRFPRIALTASTGDSSDQLDGLLKGNSLAWSLLGNITTPIFNAGRLESLEQQARLQVEQQEQLYLDNVYQAFAEVENAISNHHALTEQYKYIVLARENALAAQDLSFNQYLKGLVEYTTVLESERRAFDAQTSLVQLKNNLIQNRITLHLAMGGRFQDINPPNTSAPRNQQLSNNKQAQLETIELASINKMAGK